MNKPTAKVAVITRTKDRPTFLRRAMRSVHSQTMTDFIHLIYNDAGDTSAVEKVVAEFDQAKDKVTIITGPGSNGMEDTIFNQAIKETDSEFIVIHDDDDSWHRDFLQHTTELLEKKPALGGVVVRTDKVTERVNDNGNIEHLRTSQWLPDVKVINLYRQCIDNQMTSITFLYRRSAYQAIGGYDDRLAVGGDWDFGLRLLMKYEVDYHDPGYALANYHHRAYRKGAEGNTSAAGNDRARYYTNLMMNNYLREELAEGRLGVGFIMSQLRYNQSNLAGMVKKVLPSSITDRLKKRLQN